MADPRTSASLWVRLRAKALHRLAGGDDVLVYELAEELVRTHGWRDAGRVGAKVGAALATLEERFGVADAQLLVAFAAFWEGCTYCSRGHLLASNVLRHHHEGRLFPVTPEELLDLQALRDDEVMEHLRVQLVEFPEGLRLLTRQFELRAELVQPTEEDAPLMASLSAWSWMADCTIMLPSDLPVRPLSPEVVQHPTWLRAYEAALRTATPDR
ncbi:MAG: hypothetical protein KTR31_27995 [Myxococcales bacterium]|nr:hypothetical protein [Myxococcales bacterium]